MTIWVITVVPLLVFALAWTLWTLPVVVPRILDGVKLHATTAATAFQQGLIAETILACLSIFFLALPLVGLAVVLGQLLLRLSRALTRRRSRAVNLPAARRMSGP